MTDTDIVTRLRSQMPVATYSPLMWEAADEIERLRAEVQRLRGDDTVTVDWDEARAVWVCRKPPEA